MEIPRNDNGERSVVVLYHDRYDPVLPYKILPGVAYAVTPCERTGDNGVYYGPVHGGDAVALQDGCIFTFPIDWQGKRVELYNPADSPATSVIPRSDITIILK